MSSDVTVPVFSAFAPPVRPLDVGRAAITAATLAPEPVCVPPLLDAAAIPLAIRARVAATARVLIERLRAKRSSKGVQALVQEYALNSKEGMALMCLAEALLRIPDSATKDTLIRDKIAEGDWASHLGGGRPAFVNLATLGMLVTGKLLATSRKAGISGALARMVAAVGGPVIRFAVDFAMRAMGGQFVTGQSIDEALRHSRAAEARGFSYSYDMLGEAATSMEDADRYFADYEGAIHAIGAFSAGRGIQEGPGISIKLSALHPRYARAQADRVMGELLPKVRELALLARGYDIGFNIDAEEADRLEISLDILQSLAEDPALAGWDGLGFVVQAYSKRCPLVIDHVIALARRTGHRIMVRLVKGAYWDSEIKRAQVEGLPDYPVYTRKAYTDVAYIACAKKLLAARDVVFPQFATHNAHTLATIYELAGPDFKRGDYEFQCLHGMGEPLYEEVVGKDRLDRPCRIYAPVGTHETLLAYLVRRLLENGANSSFVNRIGDPDVSIDELIADPVEEVRAMPVPGAPHDQIPLPAAIYGARRNSAGLDLSDEAALALLSDAMGASARRDWAAVPEGEGGTARDVRNPADHRDVVGRVVEVDSAAVGEAMQRAAAAVAEWSATPAGERAACLERAADMLQDDMPILLGLIIREAGKSAANAIAEVREAIDFLRYYAAEARRTGIADARPLGPVVCISPWNFPLAIFIGQVAAALVAGNSVLAKPAEETPLIAAEAVRMLHAAGVPKSVLQLVPGDGRVGAALVGASETAGVMFTGSTEVARLIQKQLAASLSAAGKPIPLIAETGGQNAMIVDSSALAEQVVADVLASAFDSAGQRCSALRLLCLQTDIADRLLEMLRGALRELSVGRTDRLSVDIGPVITDEAGGRINDYIATMRKAGRRVEQVALDDGAAQGSFVPPTIIELDSVDQLGAEVFGPVLHVIRYRSGELDALVDAINATGYGLTFGLHTRIDETIARVTRRVEAGNLYINRNVIGAVVGVQPFGGHGLSGTGPKAGGPLYLTRLVATGLRGQADGVASPDAVFAAYRAWLDASGDADTARIVRDLGERSHIGREVELPGPVGERNLYAFRHKGSVGVSAKTRAALLIQIGAVLATGNAVIVAAAPDSEARGWLAKLPPQVAARIAWSAQAFVDADIAAALVEGDADDIRNVGRILAARPGRIVTMQAVVTGEADADSYVLDWLVDEVSTSINTTAAGGNAHLMAVS